MTVRDWFNDVAQDYEALTQAVNYGGPIWLDELLATLPDCARAVDLACATGLLGNRIRARFPGIHLVGVDFAENMVATARSTGAYDSVLLHDLDEPLPVIPTGSCDLVVALGVVEYLQHPERMLSECGRILAPDGTLLMSFMEHRPADAQAAPRQLQGKGARGRAHTRDEVASMLKAQGLHDLAIRPCTGYIAETGAPRPYLLVRARRGAGQG